jgi:hypothetical protein
MYKKGVKMNKPLFQIVFEDSSVFNGGDYQKTKWVEIPLKKIRTLFYLLPSGDYIGLGGYERFYHMIEVAEDLNGDKAGIKNLEFDYIIGQKKEYTTVYQIDLKTGCINLKNIKNNDKFLEKLNQEFWR